MKFLEKALQPLRRKILLEQGIHWLCIGLGIGLVLDIILLTISKWIPVGMIIEKILFLTVGGVLIGAVGAWWRRPTWEQVARAGDALGFQERFVTAVELLESTQVQNEICRLAINDAVETARQADLWHLYKISVSRKKLMILFLLLAAMLVVGFAPSPVPEQLEQRAKVQRQVGEEVKKVERLQEELKNNRSLTKKEIQELNQQLIQLNRDMKKAKTEGEAIKSIQKAQQELRKIANQSVHPDLKKLGEKLSEHSITRELGEKLQKGNTEQIRKDLEKIEKMLENLTEEELQNFIQAMEETAQELKQNPSLQQALQAYANTLQSGSLDPLKSQYEQLGQQLDRLAEENAEMRSALEQIEEALKESNQRMQEGTESGEKDSSNGQKEGEGQGQGQGQGEGQGQGQGQGEGQGQGQGQGQGEGQGQGQGQGQQSGAGRGTGHLPNENIYTREAAELQHYDTQVQGQKGEGGMTQQVEQKAPALRGESVPYTEVYQQYKNEALKSLEDNSIPHGMRQLIEEYFSSLE